MPEDLIRLTDEQRVLLVARAIAPSLRGAPNVQSAALDEAIRLLSGTDTVVFVRRGGGPRASEPAPSPDCRSRSPR